MMNNNVRLVGEARQSDVVGTHSCKKNCQREGKLYLWEEGGHMIFGEDPGKSMGFERP